jgi:hypothetical protein
MCCVEFLLLATGVGSIKWHFSKMRREKRTLELIFTTAQKHRPEERHDAPNAGMEAGWGGSIWLHVLVCGSTEHIPFNTFVPLRIMGCTRSAYSSVQIGGHRILSFIGGSDIMV